MSDRVEWLEQNISWDRDTTIKATDITRCCLTGPAVLYFTNRTCSMNHSRLTFDDGHAGSDAMAAITLASNSPRSRHPVITLIDMNIEDCDLRNCWAWDGTGTPLLPQLLPS